MDSKLTSMLTSPINMLWVSLLIYNFIKAFWNAQPFLYTDQNIVSL